MWDFLENLLDDAVGASVSALFVTAIAILALVVAVVVCEWRRALKGWYR